MVCRYHLRYVSWAQLFCRFDIITFDFNGPEDEPGALKSRNEVNKFIEQEINQGIPANRIVVGGFSQGGAMSLVTGLTSTHKLAGLAVMSGWFAVRGKVKEVRGAISFQLLRFDVFLAASWTTRNICSHLLGTRCGRSVGPAVDRKVIKGRTKASRGEGSQWAWRARNFL